MIKIKLIKIISVFLFLLIVFSAESICGNAQDLCPLKTVKLNKIQGKIMAKGSRDKVPLPHTKIELERLGSPVVLVATVETDEEGFFEINNIKKGEYRLVVHYIYNGVVLNPKYNLILKVKKSNADKSKKFLYVELAFDCGNTTVKLVKRKQSD